MERRKVAPRSKRTSGAARATNDTHACPSRLRPPRGERLQDLLRSEAARAPLEGCGRVVARAERLEQRDHLPDDHERRRAQPRGAHLVVQRAERRGDHSLRRRGAVLHGDCRRGGGQPRGEQPRGEVRQRGEPHVDDERALGVGERRPRVALGHAVGALGARVPRDEADGVGVVAVRQRHAELCGDARCGGDARHDGDGDAVRLEVLHLLAAAAEDGGVASLEAADCLAARGELEEQLVDLPLRPRVHAGLLAHV
mmetsp:Transcript_45840/g.113778  ORF Transcript_45840/g.113778 Transcript_45840/m.113778 type:complete len:255 (-) Transcript_45840:187-951(-)